MKHLSKRYILKILNDLRRYNSFFSWIDELNRFEVGEKILKSVSLIEKKQLIEKKYHFRLVECLAASIANNEFIIYILNSHSLIKNSEKLRDKPQYGMNKILLSLAKEISTMLGCKLSFKCILSDIDLKFYHSSYELRWKTNANQIENFCKEIDVSRLSMPPYDFFKIHDSLLTNTEYLELVSKHADYYNDKVSTIINFHASRSFVVEQVIAYSITGLILQKLSPFAMVFDIQKKKYPFEQPMYNLLNEKKIPIIYFGQELI